MLVKCSHSMRTGNLKYRPYALCLSNVPVVGEQETCSTVPPWWAADGRPDEQPRPSCLPSLVGPARHADHPDAPLDHCQVII